MIALSVVKRKTESEISLEINFKTRFCEKFGSIPTLKKARNIFVTSLGLSDHQVLHDIASSSSFFGFARIDFPSFFSRISYSQTFGI